MSIDNTKYRNYIFDFKAAAAFDDSRDVLFPDHVLKVQGLCVGFVAVDVGPEEGAVDAQFFKADFGPPGGVECVDVFHGGPFGPAAFPARGLI